MDVQRRVDGCFRVAGKQRGNFHRHPAVRAARPIVYWAKQIGGAAQILESQFHEEPFADHSRFCLSPDLVVIGRAAADGFVENRRIRGQAGHRQFVHVATQCSLVEKIARDVVEPKTLA
jgi:hypothetical protein